MSLFYCVDIKVGAADEMALQSATSEVKMFYATVESRYIELGYFEVSLISNRCQRPGN